MTRSARLVTIYTYDEITQNTHYMVYTYQITCIRMMLTSLPYPAAIRHNTLHRTANVGLTGLKLNGVSGYPDCLIV